MSADSCSENKGADQLRGYHEADLFCLFVRVDALRPRSTTEVMVGRSVILSTLFLGKPPRGR